MVTVYLMVPVMNLTTTTPHLSCAINLQTIDTYTSVHTNCSHWEITDKHERCTHTTSQCRAAGEVNKPREVHTHHGHLYMPQCRAAGEVNKPREVHTLYGHLYMLQCRAAGGKQATRGAHLSAGQQVKHGLFCSALGHSSKLV